MRYLSLFSGFGGAELAFAPLGWECVAVSEIDRAASSVLKYHWPSVPNLGDITKITQEQIEALGHIDLVIGGFPCQDVSVAGKRTGLKDKDGEVTRSGLFFDAMRIVRWSRARWTIIENVPGLFSSNKGEDFAAVVGEMVGVWVDVPSSGWRNAGVFAGPSGLAEWAILDAQFFRVAQRRRRVFLVRDTGDWYSRQPILLNAESMCWDSAPRRETGKRLAGCLKGGSGERGWPADIAQTLDSHFGDKQGLEDQHINGGASLFVPVTSATITGNGDAHSGFKYENGILAFDTAQITSKTNQSNPQVGDPCHTLAKGSDAPAIAYALQGSERTSQRSLGSTVKEDCSFTLNTTDNHGVASGMQVRRLTPTETARLQGVPDDHCRVQHNGRPMSDGNIYKMHGNGFCVPVVRYIGERIQMVDDLIAREDF